MKKKHVGCWELFIDGMQSFSSVLVKLLAFTVVFSDKAAAREFTKYTFFDGGGDSSLYTGGDDFCVHSYPGAHLIVGRKNNKYDVKQSSGSSNLDKMNLKDQLAKRSFVGDFFCNGKLETLKDSRLDSLEGSSFHNSRYTVDLSDYSFIEIERLENKPQ